MPEISIVVSCFNYGHFLDEAIDSALEQTFEDFEILVVDDGSTDPETKSVLADFERPKTRVIRLAENRGAPVARNVGVRASSGRYACALDADDRLHPRYLEKTKALLDEDRDDRLGFVTTWLKKFGTESEVIKPEEYDPLRLAVANSLHATSLFRRQVWEEVGGYREHLAGYEDWNLWLNLVAAGYRWAVVPEVLLDYRRYGASRSRRSLENRVAILGDVIDDNKSFYERHHKQLLLDLYERYTRLDNVWKEKHRALEDNAVLARQLADEQRAHAAALAEYRKLERYCRSLEQELAKKREMPE